MAEIRKFNPSLGEGIGKLVREAVGDVRPHQPGERADDATGDQTPASPETPPFISTTFSAGAMSFLSAPPATEDEG